jgi:hypothetical protein
MFDKPGCGPQKPRCKFRDLSSGTSNFCHAYTLWEDGPLVSYLIGVIVVNDEFVLNREPRFRWKPPSSDWRGSTYGECDIVVPEFELKCETANMR